MGKLFSTPLRRGTNSLKWDLSSQRDVIPLWVADMDFTAPPAVIEAVQRRAGHGVFGYTYPGRSYFSAYAGWMQRRHGCIVSPRELLFAPGVMPLLRVALSLLVPPGGKVVVPEPVYYPFFSAVRDNGMQLVSVALVQDSGGRYMFDIDSLVPALQGADALLLCSPQNPVGRVWTEQELKQVLTAAAEAGTAVLVDEIHQDILYPGVRFVPAWDVVRTAGLDMLLPRMLTVTAPSKTFNIPGLAASLVHIRDAELRRRVSHELKVRFLDLPNILSLAAGEAAYNHGDAWLDEVLAVIYQNYEMLRDWAGRHDVVCTPQDGTYIVWLDFRGSSFDTAGNEAAKRMRSLSGVWLNEGADFTALKLPDGRAAGTGFLRCNVATDPGILSEGLQRIGRVLQQGE